MSDTRTLEDKVREACNVAQRLAGESLDIGNKDASVWFEGAFKAYQQVLSWIADASRS